jgi:hypothetical protein
MGRKYMLFLRNNPIKAYEGPLKLALYLRNHLHIEINAVNGTSRIAGLEGLEVEVLENGKSMSRIPASEWYRLQGEEILR